MCMDKFTSFVNSTIFSINESGTGSDTSESDSSESDIEMPNLSIEAFVEGSSFSEYVERFEAYLMLNRVTSDTQKTVHFVGACGAYLYSKVSSACNPRKPIEVPFSELKQLLKAVLCPQHLEVVERAKFYSRNQRLGENAASFALALRNTAQTCNFGDSLRDQLRDRFVMGLREDATRRMIIQANPNTLEDALAAAQTNEISEEVTRVSQTSQSSINRFQGQRQFPSRHTGFPQNRNMTQRRTKSFERCRRCDRRYHNGECPAKFWKCFTCGKIGHISRCCPDKDNFREGKCDEESDESIVEGTHGRLGKFYLTRKLHIVTEPPLFVCVNINGFDFKCEVDCGAATGVMSSTVYKKCFKHCPLYVVSDKVFTLANDVKCELLGAMNVVLNSVFKSQILIIESLSESPPLIGRTWLSMLFPNWRSYFTQDLSYSVPLNKNQSVFNRLDMSESKEVLVNEIKTQFKDVFESKTTPIRNFSVNLKLKDEVKPEYRKASVVPYSLRETVTSQLQEMARKGIIEKVDFSNWASQIVLAKKKDGQIRICCNYKPTLNPNLEDNHFPIPNVDDILFSLNGNKCQNCHLN